MESDSGYYHGLASSGTSSSPGYPSSSSTPSPPSSASSPPYETTGIDPRLVSNKTIQPQLDFLCAHTMAANQPPMPGNMQVRVRAPRAERKTTSCTECQRRKQKCNKGHPCSNCLKRFPQPECKYKENKRRNPITGLSDDPTFVVVPDQTYDYSSLYGAMSNPMLVQQQQQQQQQNMVPMPIMPQQNIVAGLPVTLAPASLNQLYGGVNMTPGVLAGPPMQTTPGAPSGTPWPGFEMMADSLYTDNAAATASAMAAGIPNLLLDSSSATAMNIDMSGSGAGSSSSNNPFGGPVSGNEVAHREIHHDAFQALRARDNAPSESASGWDANNMDDFYSWLRLLTWTSPLDNSGNLGLLQQHAGIHSSPLPSPYAHQFQMTAAVTTPGPEFAQNPFEMVPAMTNVDLPQTYVRLLSRFKFCLDPNPNVSTPYTKFFAPYCLQIPLLGQVAAYTSTCFLQDSKHLDMTTAATYKDHTLSMLNTQLRSRIALTNDDAITAVIQLIMNEWYLGDDSEALPVHMQGLREMIRVRGGLRQLGMNGVISKLAVAAIHMTAIHRHDVSIALAYDMAPFLPNGAAFDVKEPLQVPFRVAHNTPLVAKLATFAQCADALKMHPMTASILDDIRFLISLVLALPEEPTANDLQKVQNTAEFTHNRIERLPVDSPISPQQQQQQSSMRHPSIVLSEAGPSGGSPSLMPQFLSVGSPAVGPSSAMAMSSPRRPSLSSSPQGKSALASRRRRSISPLPSRSPSARSVDRSSSRLSSRRGSPQQRYSPPQQPLPPPLSSSSQSFPQHQQQPYSDGLYQAVRQTALMYCRAILHRQPLSDVVEPEEFLHLWTTTWRVSLTAWKGMIGVFMWISLAIVSIARDTPRDRFIRSMLSICAVQMGIDSWDLAIGAFKAQLRVNSWLMDGTEDEEDEEAEEAEEAEEE